MIAVEYYKAKLAAYSVVATVGLGILLDMEG